MRQALRPLIFVLVESMEWHSHLKLVTEVRCALQAMSAATIDRALCKVKQQATGGARRRSASSTGVRAACRSAHSMAGIIRELEELGFIYSRVTNPTHDALEARIAALEGGSAALAVASGQAASAYSVLNLAGAGDNIVSSTDLCGGT